MCGSRVCRCVYEERERHTFYVWVMCGYMCVCVEREREREREATPNGRRRELTNSLSPLLTLYVAGPAAAAPDASDLLGNAHTHTHTHTHPHTHTHTHTHACIYGYTCT